MPTSNPRLEVFQGQDLKWYWHERASNGKVVMTGGQSFDRRWSAKRAAKKYNKRLTQPLPIAFVKFQVTPISAGRMVPVELED